MDKFIIRIFAILANLYIPIVLYYAMNGIDISEYDYIFSSTLSLGVVLTVISHSQGKYHCKWIRALCYNIIAIPSLNFLDAKFLIFEDAIVYVYTISIIWSISIFITIILAINHFRKVSKVLKLKRQQHESRQ